MAESSWNHQHKEKKIWRKEKEKSPMTISEDFEDIRKLMPDIEKNLDTYDELNMLHLERATSTFLTTLMNMGQFKVVEKRKVVK